MNSRLSEHELERLFPGDSELASRMRALDWSQNPLGAPTQWPQSLKTAVRILLASRQPMWLGWGDHLIKLYNDPYKSIVGGKHPAALGQPASVVWREIWDDISPMLKTAMGGIEGTYVEAQLLIMERHGYQEETYYTFSYSPIPNDRGGTGGIFCANTDDTQRIISERQLALLHELAAKPAHAESVAEACALSTEALATNSRDLPFALIYLIEPQGRRAVLAEVSGIERGHAAAPESVELTAGSIWPFAEVAANREVRVIPELTRRFENLPPGAWRRPPHQAVVVPITPAGHTGSAGVLIVGLNPFRRFDDNYRRFVELVSSQIAANIGKAEAYDAERKRAEALAELDRAKTEFFSNVSHEFRTPLTLMLGQLEDVLNRSDGGPTPDDRERLDVAHRNSLRLLKLVNTLLDFSRIEAGRVQATYEPTELSGFTSELASVFRSAVERAGMRLVVDCPPLPELVYVDGEMWEKIVLNLLSNAFKFTFEGEIEVKLRLTPGVSTTDPPQTPRLRKDERGVSVVGGESWAELTVRDTGTGIPDEELPHIFERFHRVPNARSRTFESSGIGLALVQELVRLHGGTIEVSSVPGEGSTFTVKIPTGSAHLPPERIGARRTQVSTAVGAGSYIAEAAGWLPEEPVVSGQPSVVSETTGNGQQTTDKPYILLADDNADMREYVRRLLNQKWDVKAVENGATALGAVEERVPDLVLTDVMMPEMDGFELLQKLRENPRTRTVPVIMLSARAGEEARVEGLQAGADDYLIKPFSAKELTARVETHLEMARVRSEAAASLRESEERFRNMADNSPVMMWVADATAYGTYLNSRWYEFTGQTPETGLGFGRLDAVHPDDRDQARGVLLDANSRREAFRLEYRLRREDGEYRWAIDAAAPRFSRSGEFLGYIGSVIDITERKQAEETLQRAHDELEIKVRERTAELYKKNRYETIISAVTRSVHQTIDLQEVLENSVDALSRNVDGVDKVFISLIEGDEAVLKAYRGYPDWFIKRVARIPHPKSATWEAIRGGKPKYCPDVDQDTTMGPAGKEVGTKSYLSMPLRFEGKTIGVININSLRKDAFGQDELWLLETVARQIETAISNARQAETLRESEGRYRILFDQSSVGVYVFDKDFRITQCNEAFVKILQSSYDKILGLDVRTLKDPLCVNAIKKAYEGASSHHETFYQATNSSARLWLSARYSPLLGTNGNVVGGMAVVEDITDRKRAEEERVKFDKLESVGILAGGIAHDFNNLLAAILTTISLAKINTPTRSDVYENLEDAEKACHQAKRLTQQLLTFSKGGAPVKKLTSIEEVIRESSGFALRGSKSRYDFAVNGNLWNVEADEGQISQVINNLIINADQAMPGGGVIKVSARNVELGAGDGLPLGGGRYVEITVEDEGLGIPREYLTKIFDPYFTTKQKGSGLGLATVYSILKGHNGHIEVESELGAGTRFRLYLPASAERLRRKAKVRKPRAGKKTNGKRRILLMDDEALIRLSAGKALGDIGYDVEYARDGKEAIEAYKQARDGNKPFDVVIMDLTVPGGMGGKEAIAELLNIDPQIKAVVSSGYSNDPVMSEFGKYGFSGVVAKPYDAEELDEVVKKVMKG